MRTRIVATGPRPRSSSASTTVPMAGRSGLATGSTLASEVRRMVSSSSSRPSPVLALTGTSGTSPPYSSMMMPRSESWVLTRSGLPSGRSILLRATTMGTPAALAWSMASTVWGMMPSSAATTSTAMSVTLAPRARMAVKASWPGVSRKTMRRPLTTASLAPMCWVMPPRSPSATAVLRMASRTLVLPWSTWPMTVTMGARSTSLSVLGLGEDVLILGRRCRFDLGVLVADLGGAALRDLEAQAPRSRAPRCRGRWPG